MKKDIIELVCMIDKSISMKGREKQALQTYNSLIEDYAGTEEKCFVTTCLFAEKINMLYFHNEISFVKPLTEGAYYLEGATALYDAVKTTFAHVNECLEYLKDEIKKQINVYIITDGIDNGSVEMIQEEFETMIQEKKELGWMIRIIKPENGD
ncbi:MAG: VWA domain-containing protein [Ruminococcus sp.]|nr:VWA domain-containing protein [Ruminococcus sp.]